MTDDLSPNGTAANPSSDPAESDEPTSTTKRVSWRNIIQRSSDPMFLLDHNIRLLSVNPAWEALTGRALKDLPTRVCRPKRRPKAGTVEPLLATLSPPPNVLAGRAMTIRRVAPGTGMHWDISFLPVQLEAGWYVIGKITPVGTRHVPNQMPLPTELEALRARTSSWYRIELLASRVPGMQQVRNQVQLASETNVPVWIVGERGCGKQTVARIIHATKSSEPRPFVTIDCTRLPARLVEELLFGSSGMLATGNVGTLYLGEPQLLPRELQQQLLEAIADTTPGSQQTRCIVGSQMNPKDEVVAGRVLEALHVTLSVLTIEVPPLRDRIADLDQITERMLERIATGLGVEVPKLDGATIRVLQNFAWPGNLKELFDVLRAATRRCEKAVIFPDNLPFYVRDVPTVVDTPLSLDEILQQVERRLVALAMERSRGNKSKAAEFLGIARGRLLRKLDESAKEEDAS